MVRKICQDKLTKHALRRFFRDHFNYGQSIAQTIAESIAYTTDAPKSGDVVKVSIAGKNVLVHKDFKYAMDVYYEFYNQYLESIKTMDYTKMIELSDLAEEVDDALKRIDDIDLSNGDAAYYMDTNAKILEILKEIGG